MRILINESFTNPLEILKSLHLEDYQRIILQNILTQKPSYAYHGTNRDFKEFSDKETRSWRANKFLGNGVFLTPSIDVAKKYANANANKELSTDIIDKALSIDRDLGEFMKSLYYKGNITWNIPKFRKIIDNWRYDPDPNDVADLVNLIPNSQSLKDYNKDDDPERHYFFNIFSTTTNALDYYQIEDLKNLGLGDYRPKILVVRISPMKSILMSNNRNEIKTSNHDVVIAYDVDDLLDGIPEIIVKNKNLLQIAGKKILD